MMFQKIRATQPIFGFYYCLVLSLIVFCGELVVLYLTLAASSNSGGGDSGGGVIIFGALFFLSIAMAIQITQLYCLYMKYRGAIVTAVLVTTIEWAVIFTLVFDRLNITNPVITATYPYIGLGLPLIAGVVIYTRDFIIVTKWRRALAYQAAATPVMTPPPTTSSPS
jgi:hypothetical protein